jgi:hypothetical protein
MSVTACPSVSEDIELFGDRRTGIVGISRLSLAHHVDHLDAGKDGGGARLRLEAEHAADAALDAPVILLDPVVEILALPDADRLEPPPRALPKPAFRITGKDRLAIGLAAVDDDALGAAMTLQRFAQEAFGRHQVTVFAEEKRYRVADAVDSTVEIHPLTADLDIGLVQVPLAGDASPAPVEALQRLRREADDPAMHCGGRVRPSSLPDCAG